MWIKHIILENFASVKVGMKVNRIEIDFLNRRNKICLLLAPNGTGKTSLLSTFTPFATLGNLDVRDSGNLIIPGKSGYKEITIMDRGNEYLIKHFYSPNKESHSVKSYIQKNSEELNENGNVRSFQSFVEAELGIEINFLKLVRLGNNVTNLLKLSATDRKKFLSNLLQELDVYLNYYKKLTEDSRILKNQISHTSDKMSKTGIDDVKEAEKSLDYLSNEVAELNTKKDRLFREYGAIEDRMNQIHITDIRDRRNIVEKKVNKALKAQEKNQSLLTLDEYLNLSKRQEKDITKLKEKILSIQLTKNMLIELIDSLLTESDSLKTQLEKEKNNEAIVSAKNIFHKLRVQMNDESSTFKDFHPSYSKSELNDLLSVMIQIDQILSTTYEFGSKPIKKVTSLIKEKRSVSNFINNGLLEYDSTKRERSSLLYRLMDGVDKIQPECDHKECGMYKLWFDINALMHKEEKIKASDETEEFYKYMDIINRRIVNVLDLISSVQEIIKKLPDERKNDFRSDVIFDRIEHLQPIVDRELYNVLLTEITEYERYMELVDRCKDAEKTYEILKANSNESYLSDKYEEVLSKLEDKENELSNNKQLLQESEENLSSLQDELEYTNDMIVAKSELDELKNELSGLQKDIDLYNSLTVDKHKTVVELEDVNKLLTKRTNEQYQLMLAIDNFKTLNKELIRYKKLYTENSYIKRAMSAKEGIPLEFINIYMSNIQSTINDLLDIVYDGDLTIDDFRINADEFRIPYIKDGYLIPDIIQASQGETAFLSIALSFALISESILNYNIILLDEVDGNLDKKYRKKFIAVLEKLIDMIDAEQIFLISHNDLFSMYPVDVLSLLDTENEELTLGNYIKIIKE